MRYLLRVALALSLVAIVCGAAGAGVSVSLQPAATHTVPDRTLNIYVYVDSAGSPFNAYETVIRWDPQILEFVSAQPDTLYGEHNYDWWMPEAGPDSILISHVILQGGMAVTGPGALSSITLRTLRLGESPVFFDYIKFFRFGFEVLPVSSHDAVVYVEDPNSGVLDPRDSGRSGNGLRIDPNPVEDGSILSWTRAPGEGALLRLFGPDGRLLLARRMDGAAQARRLASLVDVRALPAGSYFLELSRDGIRARGKFIRLRE